jgi:hypothetical protein
MEMSERSVKKLLRTCLGGEAFGVDPQFWMNLENTYRLSLVERRK